MKIFNLKNITFVEGETNDGAKRKDKSNGPNPW